MGFLDLLQNLSLVFAITLGAGAATSVVGWHLAIQEYRQAVEGALDLLASEIQVDAQLAAIPQQAASSLFGVPQGTYPSTANLEAAQQDLHDASSAWSKGDYSKAQDSIKSGFKKLNETVDLDFDFLDKVRDADVETWLGIAFPKDARYLAYLTGVAALLSAFFGSFPPTAYSKGKSKDKASTAFAQATLLEAAPVEQRSRSWWKRKDY